MQRIPLKGRAVTLREQQRANMSRRVEASPFDYSVLRNELNSRVFCGPVCPVDLLSEFTPDAESLRYWRQVQDFERFAYCEFKSRGTPSISTHMGF